MMFNMKIVNILINSIQNNKMLSAKIWGYKILSTPKNVQHVKIWFQVEKKDYYAPIKIWMIYFCSKYFLEKCFKLKILIISACGFSSYTPVTFVWRNGFVSFHFSSSALIVCDICVAFFD